MSSPISNTLGKDALRVALNINRRQVLSSQTVQLEPMWSLFRDQGLDPQHISIAFLRMKKLEQKLGVQVILPSELNELPNDLTISSALAREVDEILGTSERTNPQASLNQTQQQQQAQQQKQAQEEAEQDGVQWNPKKKVRNEKERLLIGGGILLVLTMASMAMNFLGGPAKLDPQSFAGTIPISEAWRVDNQVEARLSTLDWLREPLATRKSEMRRALKVLSADGVDSLILLDSTTNMRAIIARGSSGLEELSFR